MIGDGATDMEAYPPAVSTSLLSVLQRGLFHVDTFATGWLYWLWRECHTRRGEETSPVVCIQHARAH